MPHFFWETSPYCLLKQNPQYHMIKQHQIKEISFLISEYKTTSRKIKKLLNSPQKTTFMDYLYQVFDEEAYLAEIAYYLREFPWMESNFNEFDRIDSLIKKEYLIDYYSKLEFNFQEKKDHPIFMVGLLNNSILAASKRRFSKQKI